MNDNEFVYGEFSVDFLEPHAENINEHVARLLTAARESIAELTAQRDGWVRHFNRLQAAVQRHSDSEGFPDVHDEALYDALHEILVSLSQGGASR